MISNKRYRTWLIPLSAYCKLGRLALSAYKEREVLNSCCCFHCSTICALYSRSASSSAFTNVSIYKKKGKKGKGKGEKNKREVKFMRMVPFALVDFSLFQKKCTHKIKKEKKKSQF
jgi:hypothetical protein